MAAQRGAHSPPPRRGEQACVDPHPLGPSTEVPRGDGPKQPDVYYPAISARQLRSSGYSPPAPTHTAPAEPS
eukprot:1392440-Pyramimonas_sp.AAC.1